MTEEEKKRQEEDAVKQKEDDQAADASKAADAKTGTADEAEAKADADHAEKSETDGSKKEAEASDKTDTKESGTDAPEESSGRLSRKEKKELKKKDEEIASLKDSYLRVMAEYENYRKRTEKEKTDIYTFAVKDALTKILPVLDNIERGLSQIPEDEKDDPIAQGMEKIYKQFSKALDDIGVKPIEAKDQTFDPNLHNAVMHVEDESVGENTVVEELQKGYTYRGTVIRHSMVKVAN